jgi:hypothetical protein
MLFHSRLAAAAPAPWGARDFRDIQDPVSAAPGGRRVGDPDPDMSGMRKLILGGYFRKGFPDEQTRKKPCRLARATLLRFMPAGGRRRFPC